MEMLRAPWLVQSITDTLRNSKDSVRKPIDGSVTSTGELALPVNKKKILQVIKFTQWNDPITAKVSDKQRFTTAVFSESCKTNFESKSGRPLANIQGGLIQVTSFSYIFKGSDGASFWNGTTFRDQLKEKRTHANTTSAGSIGSESLPMPSPYLLILSFEHIGSDGSRTFGTPHPIDGDEKLREILCQLPRAAIANADKPTSDTLPQVLPRDVKKKTTDVTLVKKKPAQLSESSSGSDDDTQEVQSLQFYTQVRPQLEPESSLAEKVDAQPGPKLAHRSASVTSTEDIITVHESNSISKGDHSDLGFDTKPPVRPTTTVPSARQRSLPASKKQDFSDLEFDLRSYAKPSPQPFINANRKSTTAHKKGDIYNLEFSVKEPAVGKIKDQQKPAAVNMPKRKSLARGWLHPGWEDMHEVTREDAQIPRTQRKLLRLPEAWYPTQGQTIPSGYDPLSKVQVVPKVYTGTRRQAVPSGYDRVPKVQLVPKTHAPRLAISSDQSIPKVQGIPNTVIQEMSIPQVVIPMATVDKSQYPLTQEAASDTPYAWSPSPDMSPKRRDIDVIPPDSSAPSSSMKWSQKPLRASQASANSAKRGTQSTNGNGSQRKVKKPRRKARKVAPKCARKKTKLSEEEEEDDEDYYSSPPRTRELSVEPPYPVLNPYGRTRVDKYGILGAQSVSMWDKERKARKARAESGEIDEESGTEHFADAEDDDEHHELEKERSQGPALELDDNPIKIVAAEVSRLVTSSLLLRASAVAGGDQGKEVSSSNSNRIDSNNEESAATLSANGSIDCPVGSQHMLQRSPRMSPVITNSIESNTNDNSQRLLHEKIQSDPEPSSFESKSVETSGAANKPWSPEPIRPSSSTVYTVETADEEEIDDEIPVEPLVPRAINIPVIPNKGIGIRWDENQQEPPSTAPNPRPIVQVKVTPYRRSTSFTAGMLGHGARSFRAEANATVDTTDQECVPATAEQNEKVDESSLDTDKIHEDHAVTADQSLALASDLVSSASSLSVDGKVEESQHVPSPPTEKGVSVELDSMKTELRFNLKKKQTKRPKMKSAGFASQEIRNVQVQDIPAMLEEQRQNFFGLEYNSMEISSGSDTKAISKSPKSSTRKRPRTLSLSTPSRVDRFVDDPRYTERAAIDSDSDDSKDIIPAYSPNLPPEKAVPLWQPRLARNAPLPPVPKLYAGIRKRALAVPGYERLTEEQLRELDERRKGYFGTTQVSTFPHSPSRWRSGPIHNNDNDLQPANKRVKRKGSFNNEDEDEDDLWYKDKNTPLKVFLKKYTQLKKVKSESGDDGQGRSRW